LFFYKPVIDERDKIMSKLPDLAEFLKKLLNSIENDNSVKIIFPWDDKYD